MGWQKKLSTEESTSRKLSSKNEGKIKTLPDKQKLRDFVTTRPALERVLPVKANTLANPKQYVILICKLQGLKRCIKIITNLHLKR